MKKLIHQKQSEIFEKLVRRDGKFFRVRFVVIERNGCLRGKVISCEEIVSLSEVKSQRSKVKGSGLYLPAVVAKSEKARTKVRFSEKVSPYFSFDFLTSIQIRAPALS